MKADIPILVVEDDLIDVKHIRRSFCQNQASNPLYFVENGEEALAFLRHESPYDAPQAAPRPGVILLDLNMPRMSGLEFLQAYKSDPKLNSIPGVVLTTSDQELDRTRSYQLGAAGYIVKPVEYEGFVDAMKRFDLYWSLCEVPHER